MSRAESLIKLVDEGMMKEMEMQVDDYFDDEDKQDDYGDLTQLSHKCAAKSQGGFDIFISDKTVKRVAKDIGVSPQSLAIYFKLRPKIDRAG